MIIFLTGLHLFVMVAMWRRSQGGIANGVVFLSLIPSALAANFFIQRLRRKFQRLDLWICLYVCWSLISGLLFLQPGNPTRIGAFSYGLYHLVLPISCYFAGRMIGKQQTGLILAAVLVLDFIFCVYGLYMFLARPTYYSDFVIAVFSPKGATEDWQFYARMQSYLGSTTVGYLSTRAIVLTTMVSSSLRPLLPAAIVLLSVCALLSFQRAGLISLLLALGCALIIEGRRNRPMQIILIGLMILLPTAYSLIDNSGSEIQTRVESRATIELVEGFQNFFGERGYMIAIEYIRDFPLGIGLGGTSSAADNAGLLSRPEVADANYGRIAADLGPVGLVIFLIVVGASFREALRTRIAIPWISLLLIHFGIMLSTNIQDSYYVSHSFWLLLATLRNSNDIDT